VVTPAVRRWLAGVALWLPLVTRPAIAQVDPSGAWRTWTAPHFRIHAPARLAPQARELAAEAERAWGLLAGELHPPRGRIELTLLDNVDFSNGFTSTFPSNRIVIYLPPPATDPGLGTYDRWLRLVTTHELVHVFHLDRARGIWAPLRAVFGRNAGLFPNASQPSWVSEGLAVYYESRFTTAGRIRGGFHTQLLTALAPSPEWPGPGDATLGSPVWPAGQRPYAWGSRFFDAEVARYGDSLVPRFVERSAAQLWAFGTTRALRLAGGDSVEQGWAALRQAVRPAAPAAGRVIVASGLRQEPHLRVGPGERDLAFVYDDGVHSPTVVRRTVRGDTTRAGHGITGEVDLAWSGDTLWIAQLDFVSPVAVRQDLYAWWPNGEWTRVTHGERLGAPYAAPRDRIGAVRLTSGGREPGVLTAGGGFEPLDVPPADDWGRVAVSPDGRRIAAARHRDGRWDIVTWPVGRPGEVRAITDDAALDADPAWSPDGASLGFAAERGRRALPQVLRYDFATGRLTQLTDDPTGAREPALLSDGSLLYVTVLPDGYAIVRSEHPLERVPEDGGLAPAGVPPATPVPLSDGGAFNPWPALVPRYWAPQLHDERTTGLFIGGLTGSADPIGRTQYDASAAVAPATGRWEAAVSLGHQRWRRSALDLSLSQTWSDAGRYARGPGDTVDLAERQRAVASGLTVRWRRWRTAVAVRVGGQLEHDAVAALDSGGPQFASSTYAGGVISAAASHSHRPALAISPEDGAAVSGAFRYRKQIGGDRWSTEARAATSVYVGLPVRTFARAVLAATVRVGATWGPAAPVYAIGGASSEPWEIAPGWSVGRRRSFPLRGYGPNGERFTRAAIGSLELRLPVWLVGRSWPSLPVGIDRISVSAFGEIGGGWSAGEAARVTAYRDAGAEVVADLITGFDTTVRLRTGFAIPLADGLGAVAGDLRGYIALGTAF
jgi:hypothetical protein